MYSAADAETPKEKELQTWQVPVALQLSFISLTMAVSGSTNSMQRAHLIL